MPQVSLYPSRLRQKKSAHNSRFRLHLTLALCLVALAAAPFALHLRTASAQTTDPATAFDAKADKLLRHVHRAAVNRGTARNEARAQAGRAQEAHQFDSDELNQLSDIVGIEPDANGDVKVSVIVRLAAGADESELRAAGFATGARIGNIVTVEADADQLPQLAALSSVRKMGASVLHRPLNDRARREVGIDNSSGQRVVGQTGRGVVVGIIDTGIDFRHGDFRKADGTTRIKALYDVSDTRDDYVVPNPLPGASTRRGHVYTEADINAALQNAKPADPLTDIVRERDLNGHGTHVAGTAAGNGLGGTAPGTYAGMAPEADLVIVKATRSTTSSAGFSTSDEINALKFVQQQAAALGEPFVANLSLGGQLGPHDGTDPSEIAIDNLVSGGAGRAVCIAAGNEGSDNVHASATVPAGGSLTLDFTVVSSDKQSQYIDLYNRNLDKYNVTITRPDGTKAFDSVPFVSNGALASDSTGLLQFSNSTDEQNGQPDIFLIFKPNAPSGSWKITLQDADSNANGAFDAWTDGGDSTFASNIDNNSHLVGSPGTSRNGITVGAYVTRSASQTIGNYAFFTSPGPTADGRQKPEISAPGYYLYSSKSSDNTTANYYTYGSGDNATPDTDHYGGLAGTSMATPVTTGSVALLFQVNSGLTNSEVKSLITNNAKHDNFAQIGWYPRFGFGKLDIGTALNVAAASGRKYSISGRITDGNNNGISGVTIQITGGRVTTTRTDTTGNYSFADLPAGLNYSVYPSLSNSITYAPRDYSFNNLSGNQTANFGGFVYISGTVRDTNGLGVSGVAVTLSGSQSTTTVQTGSSGGYLFSNIPASGTYTITASKSGLTFTPPSRTARFDVNTVNFDFNVVALYSISGRVTDVNSNIVPGVTLTLTGTQLATTQIDANGNYTFTNLPLGTYTITPSKTGYVFYLPSQTYTNVANTIPPVNFTALNATQLDDTTFFVEQHYQDFLSRSSDPGGLAYWSNAINQCNGVAQCLDNQRVNVSAAFFIEQEFQDTGSYVYRLYKGTLNRRPNFTEFNADRSQVVGGATLAASKQALANAWVARPEFTQKYGVNPAPDQFVDALIANIKTTTGNAVDLSGQRQTYITELQGGATRGQVVREIVEQQAFQTAEYNRAFVLMQYFGYLRRDPDQGGYDFWLNILNTKLTNDSSGYHAMVKAFITSIEYRARFPR